MMKDKTILESSRQIFKDYLDSKGLRHTAERYMVLEVVNSQNDKFSVDMLCGFMERANRHVAKATVYNTVRCLCSCGLLHELHGDGRERLYQYAAVPRVKWVCRDCGKTREIKDNEVLAFLSEKKFRGFRQEFYAITLYGLCTTCDKKTGSSTKKRNNITHTSKSNKK